MELTLTVLGSAGSYPGPGQACSGYLVRAGGASVWLDAGPGSLAALQEHVSLTELDAVVVTHHHPDHCLDLPVARNAWLYVLGRQGVPVYGPSPTRELIASICGDLSPTLVWHDVADGDRFDVWPIRFTCSRTDHPVETLAVRADAGGRSLAYSADTGPAWSARALGPGIDLFVCEASLPPDLEGWFQHLSARQAAAMAAEAGVARLLLTHVVPGVDPMRQRLLAEEALGRAVGLALPHERHLA